jgi:WhiB family redox-sensing transcriptional regulator
MPRIRRTIVQTNVVIKHLPKPTIKNYQWQELATCRSVDPELFFYADMERGPEKDLKIKQAKQVCSTCPVIEQCRTFAIETRQDFGIWGGLDENEIYTLRIRTRKEKTIVRSD